MTELPPGVELPSNFASGYWVYPYATDAGWVIEFRALFNNLKTVKVFESSNEDEVLATLHALRTLIDVTKRMLR